MTVAERMKEAMAPKAGDVIASAHFLTERHVQSVSGCNITYLVPAANGGWWKKSCLPGTWSRWCKRHAAFVIKNNGK